MVEWKGTSGFWKQHPIRYALHKLGIVTSPSLIMTDRPWFGRHR